MTEMWKAVRGFEGVYEASDLGRVRLLVSRRGVREGHILSPLRLKDYVFVRLRINGKVRACHLARLILETFSPCRNSTRLAVAYGNGRVDDNRLSNLSWTTAAEAQARRHFYQCRGEAVTSAKLTAAAVQEMKRLYADGLPQTKIAREFDVKQSTVSRAISGQTWAHVA